MLGARAYSIALLLLGKSDFFVDIILFLLLLDQKKHPEILRDKAICQPSFFAVPAKWMTHLAKSLRSGWLLAKNVQRTFS
jgi:hypothetical protein